LAEASGQAAAAAAEDFYVYYFSGALWNASRSFSGIGYCTGSSRPNDYLGKGVT